MQFANESLYCPTLVIQYIVLLLYLFITMILFVLFFNFYIILATLMATVCLKSFAAAITIQSLSSQSLFLPGRNVTASAPVGIMAVSTEICPWDSSTTMPTAKSLHN